jgi:hypothetical protein
MAVDNRVDHPPIGFGTYAYAIFREEIDCKKRESRYLAFTYYGSQGRLHGSRSPSGGVRHGNPDAPMENLYNIVCPQPEKR